MNQLIVVNQQHPLLPPNAGKNTNDRLVPYLEWLQQTERNWMSPDLEAYKSHLEKRGLGATSVAAHIFTIRSRYRTVMKQNTFRDILFNAAQEEDFVTAKMMVDEKLQRMENDLSDLVIKTVTHQDRNAHIRMTESEVNGFLGQLQSLRDVAVFKLMLSTGLRAFEVTALEVQDLYQNYEGVDAVEVRHGKGDKQRVVPWGSFRPWAMPDIEAWLNFAGIQEGHVFRGLWKNGKARPTQMNPGSLNFILDSFPIMHNGQPYSITPHDLRYTYARWAYMSGMKIHAIQANLGHADERTTWLYIGPIKPDERAPSWMY